MKFYTKDGCHPRPLPNVLYFEDGTVRVDSTTFTEQEIAEAGWVIAPDYPSYDSNLQYSTWDSESSTFVVNNYTDEELRETNSQIWQSIRSERDTILSATDYVVLRAYEAGTAVPTEWSEYRQALRDLPSTSDDPTSIIWPDKPE